MSIARRNPSVLTETDVLNYLSTSADVDAEVAEWAVKRLEAKAKAAANRKPTADQLAAQALRDSILAVLADAPKSNRDTIGSLLEDIGVTANLQSITSNCTRLVQEGKLVSEKSKISVLNADGKVVKKDTTIYSLV